VRRLSWAGGKATPRLPLPCDDMRVIWGVGRGGSVMHQIDAARFRLVTGPSLRYPSLLPLLSVRLDHVSVGR